MMSFSVSMLKVGLLGCVLACGVSAASAQGTYFDNWPAGVAPAEVGKKLAEHFLTSPTQYTKTVFYAEAGTWYGALKFAELTHDDALRQKLVERLDPMMPGCTIGWSFTSGRPFS